MKAKDVELGKLYRAKVSGVVTTVRIDYTSVHGGWNATNMSTGRQVRIRTAARLRGFSSPLTAGFGLGV